MILFNIIINIHPHFYIILIIKNILMEVESTLSRWKPVLRITILLIICSISTLVRVFSVIRYESIIHEFDPWFNYRSTKFLVNHDFR